MRKQILLISAILLTANLWGQTKIDIAKNTTPPRIDGVVDVEWMQVDTVGIRNNFPENSPSVTSTWRALWDEEAFYLLVEVEDDTIMPFSSAPEGDTKDFKYDKIEVYFDVNDTLIDGNGPNTLPADERTVHSNGHCQSAPYTDEAQYGIENTLTPKDYRFIETLYSYNLSDKGYVYEAKFLWEKFIFPDGTTLDADMALDREIGFDVVVVDRDAVDGGRKRVAWHYTGITDEPFKNMDDCGIVICKGDATDISGKSGNQAVKIHPNPAKHYIIIENALDATFRLITLSGQVLIDQTVESQGEQINISFLKSGFYLLSVDDTVQKLVVE